MYIVYCMKQSIIFFSNLDEVVDNLDKLYDVGTFVQIIELRELGQHKLTMLLNSVRRIRVKGLAFEPVPAPVTGNRSNFLFCF